MHRRCALIPVWAATTVAATVAVGVPHAYAAVMCDGRPATIVGTPGADTLVGTDGPDVIAGLTGNDLVDGRGGDDIICQAGAVAGLGLTTVTLIGGPGNDTLSMRDLENSSTTTADLTRGKLKVDQAGGPGNNIRGTLAGFENVVGPTTSQVTYLTGDGGPNRLEISNGWVAPMGGNDIVVGAARPDWYIVYVDYSKATAAVNVDLSTGIVTGWSNDTLVGVEAVVGTNFADRIKGDNKDNRLEGRRGADVIDGRSGNDWVSSESPKATLKGGAGDDTVLPSPSGAAVVDGGIGVDTVYPATAPTSVTIDLGTQSMTIAGVTSTFTGFEGAAGGEFGDTLIGTDGDNVLFGGAGNDVLRGLAGRDKLFAGGEADSVDGGDGPDRCFAAVALATIVNCEDIRDTPGGD